MKSSIVQVFWVPRWFDFLNRQKLNIAEDKIYLALRNARKQARYTALSVIMQQAFKVPILP